MQPEMQAAPFSVEAEASVLGGMLLEREAVLRAADLLEAHDFYRQPHQILFETMLELSDAGTAIDPVTLSAALTDRRQFAAAGGAAYLMQLMEAVPSAANLEYHARIVREKSQLRRLRQIGADISALVTDGKPAAEVQERAERLIFASGQKTATDAPLVHVRGPLWEALERLEKNEADIPSGFTDLDRLTLGFPRGDLVILAARPSMGKTALGLQWAVNAAYSEQQPAAIFSLEMSREALCRRMLFTEARVDGTQFRTAPLEDDYARLAQAAGIIHKLPLYIHDRARTARDMRTHLRRLALESDAPLGIVVVDYLGKMRGTGGTENRVHEIGEITGDLKAMAVELNVPVVVLCQLSRAVEARPDKRPMMSDLRDSGEIEQDADSIFFLYRPEYYYGPTDKDGNSLQGRAELILAKQRNGATGTVPLSFRAEFTRFEDFSFRQEH